MKTFRDWLSDQEWEQLRVSTRVVSFAKHQRVYSAGSESRSMYFIESGFVGLIQVSFKGSEHLLRLFHAGQVFGHRTFFACDMHHCNATCLAQSNIRIIPRSQIMAMIANNCNIAVKFAELLALELAAAENMRVNLSDKDVSQRVAESLLYLLELQPDYLWTRREIAEFCGTSTETVIRVIRSFDEQGLVVTDGRKMRIVDKQSLLNIAGH